VLPNCYRALADAALALGKADGAERALDDATLIIEETGGRAELPFIDRAAAGACRLELRSACPLRKA
jgi:hypothetical protein